MNWEHLFDGLELYDQRIVDQKVKAQRLLKSKAFVLDDHAELADEWNLSEIELTAHAFIVDLLQKSRSLLLMHLNRRTDN